VSSFEEDYREIEDFLESQEQYKEVVEQVEQSLSEDFDVYVEEDPNGYTLCVEGSTEKDSETVLKNVYETTEETEGIEKYCAIIERNGFQNVLTMLKEELQH